MDEPRGVGNELEVVVLAAGRNARMDGTVPAYYKPLIVVNGSPLVRTAIIIGGKHSYAPPIIVVAPENALPISQVLGTLTYRMIVQPKPTGPGAALLHALALVRATNVLVLTADNVFTAEDVNEVVHATTPVVTIRRMPPSDSERFTRLRESWTWVEKVSVTPDDVWSDGSTRCWVGPIKLNAERTRHVLARKFCSIDHELAIGPHLAELCGDRRPELIHAEVHDIGTIRALGEIT